MNSDDYYYVYYRMNTTEQQKWEELANDIKNRLSKATLPVLPDDNLQYIINSNTVPKHCSGDIFSRGYAEGYGYYCVYMGERGNTRVLFEAATYEEALYLILVKIVYEICSKFVLINRDTIFNQHFRDWHYYEYCPKNKDSSTTHIVSETKENKNWIFDDKYQERKYCFEYILSIENLLLPHSKFVEQVEEYENHMNYGTDNLTWKYDFDKEEFVLKT